MRQIYNFVLKILETNAAGIDFSLNKLMDVCTENPLCCMDGGGWVNSQPLN